MAEKQVSQVNSKSREKSNEQGGGQNILLVLGLVLVSALLMGLIGYFLGNLMPLENMGLKGLMGSSPTTEVSKEVEEEETKEEKVEDKGEEIVEEPVTSETLETETVDGYQKDFKFDYPSDWVVVVNNSEFSTEVEISKGEFKILVLQGDMGASRCIYPDEDDYLNGWEGPHVKQTEYAQFQGVNEVFRRTQYPVQGKYTLCSKRPESSYFNGYSTVGFIKYETPIFPTETQLGELDKIVRTIEEL